MGAELNLPSPIEVLKSTFFKEKDLKVWVKREDLIHSHIGGNKWRKLKFNLQKAREEEKTTLLTFGGAFSNHIYATAAAGKAFGFKTIGLIRGERTSTLNPTLRFAEACGMELRFLSRSAYRQKETALLSQNLDLTQTYLLSEGGTNQWALPGCAEIADEIRNQFPTMPDYIALCCGTGGTMAGLITGLKGESKVLGFSVLKGDFHEKEIKNMLFSYDGKGEEKESLDLGNWEIQKDYHFGGYARFDQNLIDFINRYKREFQLALDPIYTAKLFFGLEDLAKKDFFKPGSSVLAIHTGGLQGIAGFNERFGNIIDT